MTEPLRVVLIGTGPMGRAWLRTLDRSTDAEVVGIVELDLERGRDAAAEAGVDVPVAASLAALPDVAAEAVINVTIPAAHLPVSADALARGLPVLCEKPAAGSVTEALAMAEAARASGRLLMISQSRRYYPELDAFRERVRALGRVGTLSCRFAKELHRPGFREEMAHPLLVDMAIHHFDQARYLTGADPVRVSATTYNPAWSWFAGDACATVDVEFDDGTHLGYVGTWVSEGTSWNGDWHAYSDAGEAHWDGEHGTDGPVEIAGSLAEFVRCVRTGEVPDTTIERNVLSLATVEAAVRSADERRPVELAEILRR